MELLIAFLVVVLGIPAGLSIGVATYKITGDGGGAVIVLCVLTLVTVGVLLGISVSQS